MTNSRRNIRNVSLGVVLGGLAGSWALAGLKGAMGAPITGAACITITLAFAVFGGFAGAAVEE